MTGEYFFPSKWWLESTFLGEYIFIVISGKSQAVKKRYRDGKEPMKQYKKQKYLETPTSKIKHPQVQYKENPYYGKWLFTKKFLFDEEKILSGIIISQ